MTISQIIIGLENCINSNCSACKKALPILTQDSSCECIDVLMGNALSIIKLLKLENDDLLKIIEDKEGDKLKSTKRYNVYITKYEIMINSYIDIVRTIETNNIYEFIGKYYCQSIERIKSISYTEPKSTRYQCEEYFIQNGYTKLNNNTFMRKSIEQ